MKHDGAGRRLRQSQLDQYDASALYGLAAVDKASHDVSYAGAAGGAGSISAGSAAGMRNNEYARMRLQQQQQQRLAGQQPYRDGVGVAYGLPYRGGPAPPPPPPLLHGGVVEHVYESPDLVRRDAFQQDQHYTPTTTVTTEAAGPAGHQRHPYHQHRQQQQPPPRHGYWPVPATSHPEPMSPDAQCPGSSPVSGLKAKSTGNYSL